MTNNTLFCGLALLVIGLFSYFKDTPEWVAMANPIIEKQNEEAKKDNPDAPQKEPKKVSATALIPAGLGVLMLVVVGVVIYKPAARKHAMHFAALLGAAALGGGLYALSGGPKEIAELGLPTDFKTMWDQPKIRSGALTALIGAIYVGLAVKSFIDARKAQAAGGQPAVQ